MYKRTRPCYYAVLVFVSRVHDNCLCPVRIMLSIGYSCSLLSTYLFNLVTKLGGIWYWTMPINDSTERMFSSMLQRAWHDPVNRMNSNRIILTWLMAGRSETFVRVSESQILCSISMATRTMSGTFLLMDTSRCSNWSAIRCTSPWLSCNGITPVWEMIYRTSSTNGFPFSPG